MKNRQNTIYSALARKADIRKAIIARNLNRLRRTGNTMSASNQLIQKRHARLTVKGCVHLELKAVLDSNQIMMSMYPHGESPILLLPN